jgi:hypothetical protein
MNVIAVLAAAAAWSAPQTVSTPHTFEGPLYASSGLAAWNWQDEVGRNAKTGAGQVRITNGVVSPQRAAPDGLVAAQSYGNGRSVLLANRELDTRGRRWRLTVTDGAKRITLATAFILFRPQLSVAPDGSAIAAWVELHGHRQIVRAVTRNGTGAFSKPATVSAHGQTTVLAASAGANHRFLAAYVRNGRLFARIRDARGWRAEHALARAHGKTHWQLTAATDARADTEVVWIRHRFTTPGHPGVRELFAAGFAQGRWSAAHRIERDNAVGPTLYPGPGPFALAYAFGPNSHAVARVRELHSPGIFGPPMDAAPAQGGLRSVSVTFDAAAGLVAGWVIPNPSGDGGGIGYAAATGATANVFGPREQVTPNEATFDMRLIDGDTGVRAFWTARPGGTGPSVPVSQVKTVVRTAVRSE